MRPSGRTPTQLRPLTLERHYTKHAEGSVLVTLGGTRVLCTASVVESVPRFLKDTGRGWLTAEYGMLPRSTHSRIDREAVKGKQNGRTVEIQRLIGRSLRSVVDLSVLGPRTLAVDCDVIQADGGTRTASITGACVAVADAIRWLAQEKKIKASASPLKGLVAAVSVGIYNGVPVLDLDYDEDSKAETDMNVIMTDKGAYVEIQGTAEGVAFQDDELQAMLSLAKLGIDEIITLQKNVLS